MYDVVIIGAGIVGASIAFTLSQYEIRVLVLEKENDIAMGTTRANSAIVHAGYDPEPETLMARLNLRGAELTKEWCEKLGVHYRQCGSLVLAFSETDKEHLEKLLAQGQRNGVPDLRIIEKEELQVLEPNLHKNVLAALYAPTAAIVNPWEFAIQLIENAVRNEVVLERSCCVDRIVHHNEYYEIFAGSKKYEGKFVFNAAGLSADTVHNFVSKKAFEIYPEKGEYFILDKSEGNFVNHVIFQCPTNKGKGVLVSPTVHGNLIVGPDSEPAKNEFETETTAKGLAYVEMMARQSVPDLLIRENIRNFSGLRAVTEHHDFIIQEAKDADGFFDVAGIKSPGLTSAPAIGEMMIGFLQEKKASLTKKARWKIYSLPKPFSKMTISEKAIKIKENPSYGRVVCRCETVTEGEIIDCLNALVPPVSIDGIKRRCGTGMGRCQGGFCGSRILEIMTEIQNRSPLEIIQDRDASRILLKETKS